MARNECLSFAEPKREPAKPDQPTAPDEPATADDKPDCLARGLATLGRAAGSGDTHGRLCSEIPRTIASEIR
jgi:hypothetical protein